MLQPTPDDWRPKIVSENDKCRRTLRGVDVKFCDEIRRWEGRFRGRLLEAIALYDKFKNDSSDMHDRGKLTFAGYTIEWWFEYDSDPCCTDIGRTLMVEARKDHLDAPPQRS